MLVERGGLAHRVAKPLAAPKTAAGALALQVARVAAHLPPHRASVRGGDPGLARLNLAEVSASSRSFDFAVGLLEGFAKQCAKPPHQSARFSGLTGRA